MWMMGAVHASTSSARTGFSSAREGFSVRPEPVEGRKNHYAAPCLPMPSPSQKGFLYMQISYKRLERCSIDAGQLRLQAKPNVPSRRTPDSTLDVALRRALADPASRYIPRDRPKY